MSLDNPVKKMFNEYVLILRDEVEKEKNGITLLDQTAEASRPFSGTVVSTYNDSDVAIGIRVAYQRSSGVAIDLGGVQYFYVRKVDIICEL